MLRMHLVASSFFVFVACQSDDDPRLSQSRARFDQLAAANQSTYRYVRYTESFAGFGADTTVQVANGAVVERSYVYWHRVDATKVPDVQWTETGADLGSHSAGFPARTLPALYDDCEHDVLVQDRAANEITLTFDAAGVLATCTYRPIDCEDDCSTGIALSSVTFGS